MGIDIIFTRTAYYRRRLSVRDGILCLIGCIFTAATVDVNAIPGYEFQFLLPLSYTAAYFLFAPPLRDLGVGYWLLNVVWFIRYMLGPLVVRISGYHISYYGGVSTSDLQMALALMVWELWIAIAASRIAYNRVTIKMKNGNISLLKRDASKNISDSITLRMVIVFLLFSAVVFVFDRNALTNFNFVFADTYVKQGADIAFGISVIVLNSFKRILTVFLISRFGDKDSKSSNPWNMVCAVFIVLLSLCVFTGMSRNRMLLEGLVYIYLLGKLFPKYKKSIFVACSCVLFTVLLTVTLYRFHGTKILSYAFEIYTIDNIAGLLNSYFAGQLNVAVGVKTLRLYWPEYNFWTIVKDLLANTVILNRFVMQIPGTVQLFNYVFYGHTLWSDQIAPTITQALGLFNVLGFLLPGLLVYLVVFLDMFANRTSVSFEVFLAALMSTTFAFFSPGNLTILSTFITNQVMLLFVPYRLLLVRRHVR